jgi:hypothetical protein
MRRIGTTARRRLRRLFPIRSRTCCWYHGGDWREVIQLVETVIGPARQLEVFDEERWRLVQRLEQLQEAAVSLVQDPLCVDSSGWVNGQHRGLSNNRTASGVSGPTMAVLPPSSVPMRMASGRGSDIGSAAGGRVGVGGDPGGGLFAELDVPAEAGKVLVPGFGVELGGGAAVSG